MTTPTPTTPGAIIGYGRRGPIRLQAGGSETAPEGAPAPPAPAQPAAPAPQPAPQTQPPQPAPIPQPPTWTPPPPPAPADDTEDLARLPQKWQKHIKDLREESAKYRTSARSETVLRHAYTTATAHGVNPDALLGSVAFAEHAKNLDPGAQDFPAKLAEAIGKVLTANPWMAQQAVTPPPADPTPATPPGPSGGDFTGTGGQPGSPTLDQQIAEAEKAGDHALAIHLKRLRAAASPPQ